MDKCKFCQTEVSFADSAYPLKDTRWIHPSQMPSTTFQHQVIALICALSLVWQISSPHATTLWHVAYTLLSAKNDFFWTPHHDDAFTKAKGSLTTAPTLSFFDLNKPTRLCTDASRQGLGFILQQRSKDGTWTLIQAVSRFLSDAESRYATRELEILAVLGHPKMQDLPIRTTAFYSDHRPQSPASNPQFVSPG